MSLVGIDLGGTKVEVLALRADGSEALRTRVASPREYAPLLDAVAGLVDAADAALGARGTAVGVGAPGSPSPRTGLHRNSNLTCMNGRPFAADLSARLARRVRVTNDANCLALSEAVDGAAAGQGDVVFGVILGTGVGGGLVVRGDVVDGRNGIAGEWGHNRLPGLSDEAARVHPCYCGRLGCLEQFLSGPALERRYAESAGVRRPLADIASRATAGADPHAIATIDWLVDALARSLSVVVNIVDPHAIVLGGGVSNVPALAPRVQAALPPLVFSDGCDTPVLRAVHGDSSGIRGAAMLARA